MNCASSGVTFLALTVVVDLDLLLVALLCVFLPVSVFFVAVTLPPL